MFEHDRSAARGEMASQKLIIFKHADKLGSAPAHKLFDLIKVTAKNPDVPARHFSDYNVEINPDNVSINGVEIIDYANV